MFLNDLQTNTHDNRNLIMKRMSNTLLINIFAWSIFGGLLDACQIEIHLDVLLFYKTVMHCFRAMIFVDLWGIFWALKILFFSRWNSPVTPGRNLLREGLERGHKESRRNLLLEWPRSLGLWPGSGTRAWSFYGFEILQGIGEGPIVFGRMKDASVLYFDARMSRQPTSQRIVWNKFR